MSRLSRTAALVAALAGLSLGAATPSAAQDVVYNVSIDTTYSRLSVSRATEDGALVEIYGAPEDLLPSILDALRLPARYGDEEFILIERDPTDDRIDRLVIVFGPAPRDDDAMCLGAPFELTSPDDYWRPRTATAAFCDGLDAESIGTLSSSSLSDPESRGFERAMALLLGEILPRRNPNLDADDCRRLLSLC